MIVRDLGLLGYQDAWDEQLRVHERVLAGGEEEILLVEHPPVITFGRRAEDSASHLVASRQYLQNIGVQVIESDRGGDITFHGPGQIVCYPIIRLADHKLSVGAYVRALQDAVTRTLKSIHIHAITEEGAIGIWTQLPHSTTHAKICALGVRIKRGVSLHGIALNYSTDLAYFNLIIPCGLSGRPVTRISDLLCHACPTQDDVKSKLAFELKQQFSGILI